MGMLITDFGGLYPKVSPRALPNDGAQTANNLMANTREFRPAPADVVAVAASGVSNPQTIYRLQRKADGSLNTNYTSAANWKVYAADVNLVKGPNNDNTTDRHYITYNDGSTAPRVIDVLGADRQLGVPRPTVAPIVTVNVVDEFTVEDRGIALQTLRDQAIEIIRVNTSPVWRGGTAPGTTTSGYLDHSTARGFPNDEPSQQVRAYRLTGATGTVSDAYSGVDDSYFSWVFDPALAPFVAQAPSGLTWTTAGTYHVCIGFVAYGRTYTLDETATRSQLAALIMPGTVSDQAIPDANLDILMDRLTDYGDPANPAVKSRTDALAAAVTKLKVLLDGGLRGSIAANTQAFYSKTDVAQAISDAKTIFANSVWNAAQLAVQSSMPADGITYSPGDRA